jgi:hypothetical protein
VSPAITDLYSLPQQGDWIPWDKIELSPNPDALKMEAFDDTILSSVPARTISLSPAVNPMDLTNPQVDDVLFCHEGINDIQPLFQAQFPVAVQRPQLTTAQIPPPPSRTAEKPSQPAQQQPDTKRSLRNSTNLKRKSSPPEDDAHLSQRSSASPPPNMRRSGSASTSSSSTSNKAADASVAAPKKTAHNMIEKRYRNNLNDKIAALRDSVPALRVMVHRLENGQTEAGAGEDDEAFVGAADGGGQDEEDLGGLAPAHKLNKATILGKATEYILHLERRNQNLARENAALRSRMEGFEMLVMSRGGGDEMWS